MKRSIFKGIYGDDDDDDDFVIKKKHVKKKLKKREENGPKDGLFTENIDCPLNCPNAPYSKTKVDMKLKEPIKIKYTENTARCPICCFPFKHLIGITENWHVMECLDFEFDVESNLCTFGTECTSFSVSHYKKLRHYQPCENSVDCRQAVRNKSSNSHSTCDDSIEKKKLIMKTEDVNNSSGSESTNLSAIIDDVINENTTYKQNNKDSVIETEDIDDHEYQTENGVLSMQEGNSGNYYSSYSQMDSCHKIGNISGLLERKTLSLNDMSPLKNISFVDDVQKGKPSGTVTNTVKYVDTQKLKQVDIGVFFGSKKTVPESSKKEKISVATDGKKKLSPSEWRWNSSKGNTNHFTGPQQKSSESINTNRKSQRQGRPTCPFYKKIPDSPFTVDAFRYGEIPGCTCYFLSHFHYDHYGGLTKHFKGRVYCSKVTANLVITQLRLPSQSILPLPLNTKVIVEGIAVTLLDANHCPGSVLFLFEFSNGRTILHTGDFRASKTMETYSEIWKKGVDIVYLDTTYCMPYYKFPTQQDTIDFAVTKARQQLQRQPKSLIICGTYTIGKEKVFHAIACALQSKVYALKDKLKVLACLEWDDLKHRLTTDPKDANVHVTPMKCLTLKSLQKYLESNNKFKEILAFKPTGWTYTDKTMSLENLKPITRPGITIYGIPYSEHSSYTELEWFVRSLKPKKIIPTVNVASPEKREEMQRIFKEWLYQ